MTQEFVGYIPRNTYPPLDATIPGFLASTSRIVSGRWQFDSSVVILPNTRYWFYMPENDLSFTTRLRTGTDAVEGDGYFGLVGVPGWDKFRDLNFNFTSADAYFTLQGDALATPEPEQSALLAGFLLLLCIWKSKTNVMLE